MTGLFAAIQGREGIQKRFRHNRNVYFINGDTVKFWGMPTKQLGYYGRKKFENMLFLENPQDNPVIRYE